MAVHPPQGQCRLMWLIIRTDHRKENYVAAQLRHMGYDAWVPAQIIVCRPSLSRRVTANARHAIRELPILPRRVFARIVDWPDREAQSDILSVRHVETVERDAEQRAVRIRDAEIASFRAAIDAENTAALALAQKASRKQKAKWRSLHDALLEMIDAAKNQLEQAA